MFQFEAMKSSQLHMFMRLMFIKSPMFMYKANKAAGKTINNKKLFILLDKKNGFLAWTEFK